VLQVLKVRYWLSESDVCQSSVFMYSACSLCLIVFKRDLSRQILVKSRDIKFHENSSSGSQVFPCGWTFFIRQIENKLIAAFSSFAVSYVVVNKFNIWFCVCKSELLMH